MLALRTNESSPPSHPFLCFEVRITGCKPSTLIGHAYDPAKSIQNRSIVIAMSDDPASFALPGMPSPADSYPSFPSSISDDSDLSDFSSSSSTSDDSEDEERQAALIREEWEESMRQMQMLVSIVIMPYFGKWMGRRWSYWGE